LSTAQHSERIARSAQLEQVPGTSWRTRNHVRRRQRDVAIDHDVEEIAWSYFEGRRNLQLTLRELNARVADLRANRAGFIALGGLPLRAIFDNAKTAVTQVLRGRNRLENAAFREFCGALALEVNFAAPAKGNEKGGVEGIIGYVQDNFFRPMPSFETLDELNAGLAAFCERDAAREHTTHRETISARFERERAVLRPMPPVLPRSCVTRYARVNKFAEVTFERDIYSVPSVPLRKSAA
jgi:hypothetical protein